eukprot:gb/GEZN01015227.1/.p1 GENE.gb/GEZN01015227.1/~~gb/GEZN01015227.1/.p1  ORF type:complete len:179 (-),score=47.08 gb/GEZN01015227.1/:344-880(-)
MSTELPSTAILVIIGVVSAIFLLWKLGLFGGSGKSTEPKVAKQEGGNSTKDKEKEREKSSKKIENEAEQSSKEKEKEGEKSSKENEKEGEKGTEKKREFVLEAKSSPNPLPVKEGLLATPRFLSQVNMDADGKYLSRECSLCSEKFGNIPQDFAKHEETSKHQENCKKFYEGHMAPSS